MVRRSLAALALGLLASCSPPDPALLSRTERPARARDLCRVTSDATLRCSLAGAEEQAVPLPFPVRSTAVRAAGGAYALGERGELVRVDARGRITGAFATDLRSLVATRDHVCGQDPVRGGVVCARDYHHDGSCPGVAMPDWRVVASLRGPVSRLRGDLSGLLCAVGPEGAEHCLRLQATCDRICLSYPACAPLRCVDPCAASEAG